MTAIVSYPFTILIYDLVSSFVHSLSPFIPPLSLWNNEKLIIASIIISLATGFISGIYPAIFLSSFRPIQILKGIFRKGKTQSRVRKALVVFQFSISVIFVVLTLSFRGQSDYIANADLGYNRAGVLAIVLPEESQTTFPIIKEQLKNFQGVQNITASNSIPGNWQTKVNVIPEGRDANTALRTYYYGIDYNFFKTLEMQIKTGRNFQKDFQDENNFIVNELFVKQLEWNSPLGKTIKVGDKTGTIVGVVNDCLFDNTFWPVAPAVFYLSKGNLNWVLIKTGINNTPAILAKVRELWSELSPNIPFGYTYLDDYFKNSNGDAWIIPKVLGMLGILAVIFSSLGLLALATYTVRHRSKEIGIRKVLGASVPKILAMLSKDFLKLVV